MEAPYGRAGMACILEPVVRLPDHSESLKASTPASRQELLARLLRERVSAERPEDHPLSYNQRSLWFLNRLDPQSAAYNVAYAWHVRSPLDVEALRRAFLRLIERHAILRTVYGATEPRQRIVDSGELDFAQVDVSDGTEEERYWRVCDDACAPFDLQRGPVCRVRLFVSAGHDPVLLVAFHHIAYDLWSMVTLVDELLALYGAERDGVPCRLPPLQYQYLDFVRWQTELLDRDGERLFAFWREYLAGELPVLALPADHPRPRVQSGLGATYTRPLPAHVADAAVVLARSEQTTVFTVLLAAYQALLCQLSGQPDVVVGSPVAGRTRPEFENLIGYFLNTLPFRADTSGDPSFRTFVAHVRQHANGVLKHQDYPLALLVERLKPRRSAGQTPLFQSLFVLNRPHVRRDQRDVKRDGPVLEHMFVDLQSAQFDLSLEIEQSDAAAIARWDTLWTCSRSPPSRSGPAGSRSCSIAPRPPRICPCRG